MYADSTLQTPYTTNAVSDGIGRRLIQSSSIYSSMEIRWSQFTASNVINTVELCDYPIIDTLEDVPQTPSETVLLGGVDSYGSVNLDEFYFFWGTGSAESDLTNVITASYVNAESVFSASIDGLSQEVNYYYRAAARDTLTERLWYGDIETFRPILPEVLEIFVAAPSLNEWVGDSVQSQGQHLPQGVQGLRLDWPFSDFTDFTSSLYVTKECTNQPEPATLVNSLLWTDEGITQKYLSASLFGLSVPGCDQPAWLPFYYESSSVTHKGFLEMQPIDAGWVVQNVIMSENVNGININWDVFNKRSYYNSPNCHTTYKLPDNCEPVTVNVDDTNLPAGYGWGWGYILVDTFDHTTLELARQDAINYNGSPNTTSDVYAVFTPVSGSSATINDMTKKIVGGDYPLYTAPYSGSVYQDDGLLVTYKGPGEQRTTYGYGWSGSLRPQGGNIPANILFKANFPTLRGNGTGDDCTVYVTDCYPL